MKLLLRLFYLLLFATAVVVVTNIILLLLFCYWHCFVPTVFVDDIILLLLLILVSVYSHPLPSVTLLTFLSRSPAHMYSFVTTHNHPRPSTSIRTPLMSPPTMSVFDRNFPDHWSPFIPLHDHLFPCLFRFCASPHVWESLHPSVLTHSHPFVNPLTLLYRIYNHVITTHVVLCFCIVCHL